MPEYFITKNLANIMTESDSSSKLDSQAIIGNLVTVEKEENGYCFVKTADSYQGWVSELRLADAWDMSSYKKICIKTLFADVRPKPDEKTYPSTRLVISTCLPIGNECLDESYIEIILPDKQKGYVKKSCTEPVETSAINEIILQKEWQHSDMNKREQIIARLGKKTIEKAKHLVGTPYLWGGCTPFGIDCSGLCQLVYRLNGVQLLRNSYMQFDDKRFAKIEKDKELDQALLQAGDLLVFDTENPNKLKINHIGIACGDGTFIQASGETQDGGVIISKCADPLYKRAFMGAVRISPKADINMVAN